MKMEKYCINAENKVSSTSEENKDYYNKKFEKYKSATPYIRECLREYSSQEKVDVLKNIIAHNERHVQTPQPSYKKDICKIKKIIGVKECLQPLQETPFQTIISELRNTVMNSYWNKEIGKTRYQIPNLPVGMNPQTITFGMKTPFVGTMAEILQQETEVQNCEANILEIYKKSHKSYLPAEQIRRNYKKPFHQDLWFGKSRKSADVDGATLKKRLLWFNNDPDTLVNVNLANFLERTHCPVGKEKNLKHKILYTNTIHGKVNKNREGNILSNCPINNDVITQKKYLQYINSLRQNFKKRVEEISFSDIFEDLLSSDKDFTDMLPEEKVFFILDKHKVHINTSVLRPLLDRLQIRVGNNVKYKELLNLLNWKYDFPTLPKVETLPLDCQFYSTTYNTSTAVIDKVDITSIPAAGISYKDLDKTTAYSLIVPNIFTRYGLSHSDLSKLRSKEEIKNIFEVIGTKFPNDSFELLWIEGLKRSGTNDVSIETFKTVLDECEDLVNQKT